MKQSGLLFSSLFFKQTKINIFKYLPNTRVIYLTLIETRMTLGNKFELFLLQTRELLTLTNLMMLISDLSSEFLCHVQI